MGEKITESDHEKKTESIFWLIGAVLLLVVAGALVIAFHLGRNVSN